MTQHIDEDMSKIIAELHEKDVTLIEMIFNLEKGIKYRDVEILIESKLKGKIIEIGNGSSHKRIRIKNLCCEFYDRNDSSGKSTVTVSTGGMYKQHGSAGSDMMTFNLKLLKSVLASAGIEPALIKKIRENFSSPKFN